jgi:hypothetical protein
MSLSIGEIAASYELPSFTRAFRKWIGPLAYRERDG